MRVFRLHSHFPQGIYYRAHVHFVGTPGPTGHTGYTQPDSMTAQYSLFVAILNHSNQSVGLIIEITGNGTTYRTFQTLKTEIDILSAPFFNLFPEISVHHTHPSRTALIMSEICLGLNPSCWTAPEGHAAAQAPHPLHRALLNLEIFLPRIVTIWGAS